MASDGRAIASDGDEVWGRRMTADDIHATRAQIRKRLQNAPVSCIANRKPKGLPLGWIIIAFTLLAILATIKGW